MSYHHEWLQTQTKMAQRWMGWTKGAHVEGQVHQRMNRQCMQIVVLTNRWSCKDVVADGRMRKHAICVHKWMDRRTCTFLEWMNLSRLPTYKQGAMCECNIKWKNDHRRLCALCHVKVKLWHTIRTSITQQHCNLTCTPAVAWMYQHYHFASCCPHLYYGTYCQSI